MNLDLLTQNESLKKKIILSQQKYEKRQSNRTQSNSFIVRLLFVFVGLVSLGLGVVGIVLPILPTVPFFILTTLCFAKGSKKFSDWFTSTKMFRHHLQIYLKYRVSSIKSIIITLLLLTVLFLISCIMSGSLVMTIIGPIVLFAHVVYFLITITPVSSNITTAIKEYEDSRFYKNQLVSKGE